MDVNSLPNLLTGHVTCTFLFIKSSEHENSMCLCSQLKGKSVCTAKHEKLSQTISLIPSLSYKQKNIEQPCRLFGLR